MVVTRVVVLEVLITMVVASSGDGGGGDRGVGSDGPVNETMTLVVVGGGCGRARLRRGGRPKCRVTAACRVRRG